MTLMRSLTLALFLVLFNARTSTAKPILIEYLCKKISMVFSLKQFAKLSTPITPEIFQALSMFTWQKKIRKPYKNDPASRYYVGDAVFKVNGSSDVKFRFILFESGEAKVATSVEIIEREEGRIFIFPFLTEPGESFEDVTVYENHSFVMESRGESFESSESHIISWMVRISKLLSKIGELTSTPNGIPFETWPQNGEWIEDEPNDPDNPYAPPSTR